MDNYSLEEVKMLINNNMVTPEVFNNILKSTTRRIELYNDRDDWKILKYLSESNVLPENAQKEISKYLNSYDEYCKKMKKENTKRMIQRKKTILVILFVAFILIAICIFLIANKR